MDVVLYRHLQIFGTVMKSRPPEVKQAMVQRFAQQWLPGLAKRGDPAGDRQHVCTGRCRAGPSAHGVWRQHRQDPVAARGALSGQGVAPITQYPALGLPQPASARCGRLAARSKHVQLGVVRLGLHIHQAQHRVEVVVVRDATLAQVLLQAARGEVGAGLHGG